MLNLVFSHLKDFQYILEKRKVRKSAVLFGYFFLRDQKIIFHIKFPKSLFLEMSFDTSLFFEEIMLQSK